MALEAAMLFKRQKEEIDKDQGHLLIRGGGPVQNA